MGEQMNKLLLVSLFLLITFNSYADRSADPVTIGNLSISLGGLAKQPDSVLEWIRNSECKWEGITQYTFKNTQEGSCQNEQIQVCSGNFRCVGNVAKDAVITSYLTGINCSAKENGMCPHPLDCIFEERIFTEGRIKTEDRRHSSLTTTPEHHRYPSNTSGSRQPTSTKKKK